MTSKFRETISSWEMKKALTTRDAGVTLSSVK